MAIGWKLKAQKHAAGEARYFLAQAPDAESAIEAVRRRIDSINAIIIIIGPAPINDLSWLSWADGSAKVLRGAKHQRTSAG
jgi:hypothetical protein